MKTAFSHFLHKEENSRKCEGCLVISIFPSVLSPAGVSPGCPKSSLLPPTWVCSNSLKMSYFLMIASFFPSKTLRHSTGVILIFY